MAYPLWFFSKGYETGESLGENVESVLMAGAIGAWIGAWIDSRINARKVLYERPAGPVTLMIAPVFSRRAVGVNVSVRGRR